MILSDVSIREALRSGRIVIDPLGDNAVQPSSVDLRVDHLFRVFRNYSEPHIDPKKPQDNLTELIEIGAGAAFVLHPGEFVLGSTLERVRLPNDLVARLEGKALALTTEVPTPYGWRTIEDLAPGDLVFTERGNPTLVVEVSEIMEGHDCRELLLSDGTTVTADVDHLWVTVDKRARNHDKRRERIVSTTEIEQSVVAQGERNHQIRLCAPVAYPTRRLPIDPYVLGIWLCDGTSTQATITTADGSIVEEILDAGYQVRPTPNRLHFGIGYVGHTRDPDTGRYARNGSLSSVLRGMGLLGDKHIPEEYLIADELQRMALLQGLMDSDGYVDTFGRCDLTTIKEHLATQYQELIASLGFTATLAKKTAWLDGVDCGPKYEVQFVPDRSVFRLPRKLARQKRKGKFHRFRAVAAVREVPSVPVRCIQVADPCGTFLVTRSYLPTHNSSLGRLGLLIHSTAGFVDAGWNGHLTLELSNVANLPIAIYPRMKIGQISFLEMTTPAEHPYGSEENRSKYQGQLGPTASRYWENFEEDSNSE